MYDPKLTNITWTKLLALAQYDPFYQTTLLVALSRVPGPVKPHDRVPSHALR